MVSIFTAIVLGLVSFYQEYVFLLLCMCLFLDLYLMNGGVNTHNMGLSQPKLATLLVYNVIDQCTIESNVQLERKYRTNASDNSY
jgi:hypothetical protein